MCTFFCTTPYLQSDMFSACQITLLLPTPLQLQWTLVNKLWKNAISLNFHYIFMMFFKTYKLFSDFPKYILWKCPEISVALTYLHNMTHMAMRRTNLCKLHYQNPKSFHIITKVRNTFYKTSFSFGVFLRWISYRRRNQISFLFL